MEDNKNIVLVLIRDTVYEVSNDESDKEQIETMVSAAAEFSLNFSDFHSSDSHVEMFLDVLTSVFELNVVPQDQEFYLEII